MVWGSLTYLLMISAIKFHIYLRYGFSLVAMDYVRDMSPPPTKIFGTSKNDAHGQNFEKCKKSATKNMNSEV